MHYPKQNSRTNWGQLVDMARLIIIHSYWLSWAECELHILIMKLLFDFAFLSQFVEDKNLWYTKMDIRRLI